MKKKQRLLVKYGLIGVLTLGVCIGAVSGLRNRRTDEPEGGRIPGVTNVLSRGIPASAPRFHFENVPLDWHHFPGKRTRRLPEDMGSGVAMADLDGDGDLDLFFVNCGPLGAPQPACGLFRNQGGFRFERVKTDLPALMGMGVAAGDYDADGDLDLYITGYKGNVLLRNEGGMRFRDVTVEAGVAGGGFCTGAVFGDADGDGDLDLYVCRYVRFDESAQVVQSRRGSHSLPATLNPSCFPPESNLLYRNNGDGTFREAAKEWGVQNPEGKGLSALFADFDEDGVLDLYVANDVTDNVMFRGRKGKPYQDVSHPSCTADWRGAMGLAAGDPDRDGDLDLFITHWKPEENALYVREQGMLFRDDSIQTYLGPPARGLVGWACGFADFDLDGKPDLWVVNGSTFEQPQAHSRLVPMCPQIFWNGGRRFFDLAPRAGAILSQPIVGRGGACGDLDGDGDLDLVIVARGHAPLVLRNDCERRGKPLVVVVRGSVPNPFAYGARVTVEAQGHRQTQQVGTQVAYLSSGPAALTFGLGEALKADRVTVRFLSGKAIERRNVPAGSRLLVKEVPARALGPGLDKARDALERGDKQTARRELQAILKLDPLHPTALYLLAVLEPPEKALQLCDRLLAVEPRVPRGYLLRARLLSDVRHPERMDLDAALRATDHARRLNRVETGGAFEAGRILLYQGQVEQASRILRKVSANPRAAALAALCRFRLGDPEAAQALLAPAAAGKDPVARLLQSQIGRDPRWRLVRLPVGPTGPVACDIVDADQDGHLDVRVGGRLVLMQGLSVRKVAGAPSSAAKSAPRSRPYSFAKAAAWALDPPRICAGPPPGTTATAEADVDGDGRIDLIAACGGDDPAAPLPWWVLLRRAEGYAPLRGGLPYPGFRAAAVAAADLDGDGRAEIVLKGGGFLPGDTGETWIATLKSDG